MSETDDTKPGEPRVLVVTDHYNPLASKYVKTRVEITRITTRLAAEIIDESRDGGVLVVLHVTSQEVATALLADRHLSLFARTAINIKECGHEGDILISVGVNECPAHGRELICAVVDMEGDEEAERQAEGGHELDADVRVSEKILM